MVNGYKNASKYVRSELKNRFRAEWGDRRFLRNINFKVTII